MKDSREFVPGDTEEGSIDTDQGSVTVRGFYAGALIEGSESKKYGTIPTKSDTIIITHRCSELSVPRKSPLNPNNRLEVQEVIDLLQILDLLVLNATAMSALEMLGEFDIKGLTNTVKTISKELLTLEGSTEVSIDKWLGISYADIHAARREGVEKASNIDKAVIDNLKYVALQQVANIQANG